MQVNTKAIVLSSLKFGDTSLIVKAYTRSDGLKSYLLKGVLSSKKGKLKAAYFQPLTQLEINAVHKNKGTLESIREVKVIHPYKTLHTNIIKNSLVLFLSEMLGNSIQEQQKDESLFNYLEKAFHWLDETDTTANFHLLFLLNLSKHLGFYPDIGETSGTYFDLVEGTFITNPSLNPLIEPKQILGFKQLLGIKFDALRALTISKTDRESLLNSLILYFELHLHGFRKPKSLAVLHAVFD